ncbi:hypothetical protein ACE939_00710 [Aquimarina sp. W85]|uniref:hypothetical protein n=1 Tax=Aquimarina rhodophyticola TaxID=3342246 RepID=UPI003671A900
MKPIDRLEQFIKHKGLSLNKFDVSIGRTGGYTGRQIKNKASIGTDIIQEISCIYKELDIHWLITGEGDMLREDATKQKTIDEMIDDRMDDKAEDIMGEVHKEISSVRKELMLLAKAFTENRISDIEQTINREKESNNKTNQN